jgi:putative inorganic carbon (HCO3(-)) transporter
MKHHLPFRGVPLGRSLALFLLSAIIGSRVAYDPRLSWPLLLTLIFSSALYAALVWPDLNDHALLGFAWLLLCVQTAFALYFVTQYSHLDYPTKIGFISRLGRSFSEMFPACGTFMPHPNAMATFIEGGVPLAVGLWLYSRNLQSRLAASLSLLILNAGLLLTASRGAWVAVATGTGLALTVWIGHQLRHRWQLLGFLGLATLCVIILVASLLFGADRIPGLSSAISRGIDRSELYWNSLHLARDYALTGIGLGDTFGRVYSQYILLIPYVFLTYAHNLPISIWLNQGLLGLIGFAGLLVAFCRLALHHVKQSQGTPLFWGAVLGVTVMLLHGLTDAPQYADGYWIMPVFFTLLGLSIATATSRPPCFFQCLTSRRRALLLTPLVVLLGVASVFLFADTFYTNLGAIQQTRAELAPSLDNTARQALFDSATRHYQQALDLNPNQPMAQWRLGLMALNSDEFDTAIGHLELAYSVVPGHRGVQKALGYAYLWDGQIERAAELLRPLREVPEELDNWGWWRETQGQHRLAEYALKLRERLG